MSLPLLRLIDLRVGVKTSHGAFPAVESVSLHLDRGEILGLVGESGCGKSLTALAIAGLLGEGVSVLGGKIVFEGSDLAAIDRNEMRKVQGKDISMIFQEPMTSLNPLTRVGAQIEESLILHTGLGSGERREAVVDMLGKVGLPRPKDIARCYPHQLSGGMLQRAMIAMALVCKPKLIIADEPTTALDVTIQTRILELLRKVNAEFGCAILFISHDLGVINQICDRVAVMYSGEIIEEGKTSNIFIHPVHEYTKGLLGSLPAGHKKGERLASIPGRVPSIEERISGCKFSARCGMAIDECFLKRPASVALGPGHRASCRLAADESEMEYERI
jgi:peptide/nickel transport system ATP-binding protein